MGLMQGVNILSRAMVHRTSPSAPILYEIAWQVDQTVSQVYTHAISTAFVPYWSAIEKKETYVYMRPACASVSLASHSSIYAAIQDVAVIQQCLQQEKLMKEVKLETKSALTFPMLNEGFGKHSSCNLKTLNVSL